MSRVQSYAPPLPPPNPPKQTTNRPTLVVTNRDMDSLTPQRGGAKITPEKPYINISYLVDGQPDVSNLPLAAGTGRQYQPHYVNIPIATSHSGTGTKTEALPQRSQTVKELADTIPHLKPKERSDSHMPLSHARHVLPPRQVAECSQCKDLLEWLSLWELGVSGLTRQYSQILAQLNHARDAATIIECKMREQWAQEQGEREGCEGGKPMTSPRKKMVLSSVDDSVTHSVTTTTLADQMYPQQNGEGTNGGENPPQLPAEYMLHFAELTCRLGRAIDLCQQLAASSFKTQTPGLLKMKMKNSFKKSVQRQTSTPAPLTPELVRTTALPREPLLSSLAEDSELKEPATKHRRGVLTRMETEPALMVSSEQNMDEEKDEEKEEERERERVEKSVAPTHSRYKPGLSRSKTQYIPKKEKLPKSSIAGDLFNGELETQPVRSHKLSADEVQKVMGEGEGGENSLSSSFVLVGSSESDEGEEPVSRASTFSDTDVKQVMSKIALLEDERLKLLETIDQMQRDNQSVRLSLYETLGDLENKDLQLTLAMQDLTIATDEIKKVAGLKTQLDTMERERESFLDKLSNLEDESSAVKVSLIQLLQEKSATNKTLALENWRLRQSSRQGEGLSRTNSRSSTTQEPAVLPYIADDLSNYVHKQGFLVKQGRRVKNWKRRLFVLDSNGLSYYRTEQPIHKISLSDMKKIQVAHNHLTLPHMFEVHTPERVFHLSAPSEDEMQSWVGMLQTLKLYARQHSPTQGGGEPVPNVSAANAILHQAAVENGAAKSQNEEWTDTTLPTSTGSSVPTQEKQNEELSATVGAAVQKRYKEKEKDPTNGVANGSVTATHNGRPRSQALTLQKKLSLDEAIPQSSRPMSALVTTYPGTSGTEWDHEDDTAGLPHPSPDNSVECNRVLSKSHPGTGAHDLTSFPATIFET